MRPLRHQRLRRLLREQSHRAAAASEVERQYARLATRGVVQLFNAVQRSRRQERQGRERDKLSAAQLQRSSADGFLQLVRTAAAAGEQQEVAAAGATGGDAASNSGWRLLRDDWMLGGGRLADWDRQSSSEDEEQDGNEAAGAD